MRYLFALLALVAGCATPPDGASAADAARRAAADAARGSEAVIAPKPR